MASSNVSKSILLLLLVILISAAGLVWFDYLNVIDIKTVLAPIYNKLGIGGRSQELSGKNDFVNLDAERLAVRLESIELEKMEMEKEADEILRKSGELEQIANELQERQKALDDKENALSALEGEANSRDKSITQQAIYLNNMNPQQSIAILSQMEDELVISVLRKVDQIAAESGGASMVSVWLSGMEPSRAAEISRKMTLTP
ncbi:MAG: hypothetical protein Ta2G_07440 [Termitinemataceae bacterium]|nr:MAG: hypothetical protein Ta2G_07440 [Termitinemataceae bacterium]